MPAAILLSGPRGVGKRAFARALAQASLCRTVGEEGFACGRCESCRLFEAQGHPDYRLLEPASEQEADEATEGVGAGTGASRFIVIKQVRELAGFLSVSAHLAGQKVVVIQPADRLHPGAANALLKTLEEPPSRTAFILVADDAQQLAATVRSRCFRLSFALPEREAALAWLQRSGVANVDVALAQAGYAPLMAAELESGEFWGIRSALLDAFGKSDTQFADILARAPTEQLQSVLGHLYRWCYDLLSLRLTGRLRYNPDQAKRLAEVAVRVDMVGMLNFMKEFLTALRSQEHPLNARLVLERLAIGYVRTVMTPPA